jgi:hypothetical protein
MVLHDLGDTTAWSTYSAVVASGWANLDADTFFSSPGGRVFRLRKDDEATPFRDENGAISMSLTLRMMDFGELTSRKFVRSVATYYRTEVGSPSGHTTFSYATDMSTQYHVADLFVLRGRTATSGSGLSQTYPKQIEPISNSIGKRSYSFQFKYWTR